MKNEMVVSISSVIARIKNVLTQTMDLDGIWVQGEISNLTKHRSGHYYFSLKDKSGEMSCVMFSSYVSRLNFNVQEGMRVLVSGSINVYEQRGSLQLVIRQMKQDGLGDLYLEFEKRKQDLLRAGYFDESHKKAKPESIENIGVITGAQAAALQDVLSTIQKRWPMMQVTLYPSFVQGNFAPKSLIQSLKKADTHDHDALLIVRGGGSFEDLFCFNDVELVRTIYNLNTYIVSGVGHEVDTTLCDLVCDHRSVTPTAAAQWVTLDQYEVMAKILNNKELLSQNMSMILNHNKVKLDSYKNHPYLKDPKSFIIEKQLKLDGYNTQIEHALELELQKKNVIKNYKEQMNLSMMNLLKVQENKLSMIPEKLESNMRVILQNSRHSLQKNCALLDAYSPLKVLSRGYSISKVNDKVIRHVKDVTSDDIMVTRVNDGVITSCVVSTKEE
ncbi:exodeoxyribonuclease VII large subunit [uncultured Holdemanella sp.]|uniref:exodeoxyribonuclease VII large subunit n=1 Tax=uncultured Holdemanella sp. TaxID=1763549 RepID=UPI0025CEAD98|nr:exodeoxyribonuclease VII large subunit [uncultured Holdemanella sp.]